MKALEVKIRERRDEFRYVDDPSVLIELYKELGDFYEQIEEVLKRFHQQYKFLKMYHCCRPTSVEEYYDSGIQILDMSEMNSKFQRIFLGNPKYPMVTPNLIQDAIEYMSKSYKREGYVYFGIDDRFLIDHCGHYLIEGSEYLQGLAAFIERETGPNLKSELRRYGKPTIFKVRIPLSTIHESDLRELVCKLLYTWAYNLAHDRSHSYKLDFSIELDQGLPPDHIIGHYHPEEIPDPSNNYEIYHFSNDKKEKSAYMLLHEDRSSHSRLVSRRS